MFIDVVVANALQKYRWKSRRRNLREGEILGGGILRAGSLPNNPGIPRGQPATLRLWQQ